jgi:hypothetical protein
MSLKGNKKIAVISLNTKPIVNPTILKGNRISQIKGNKNNKIRAIGQQKTSKMNQRVMAINVFMNIISDILSNEKPV